MKQLTILILLGIILCCGNISCSSPSRQKTADTGSQPVIGVLNPKVTCTADPSCSYALYLPRAYDTNRKWPVIFCFDASARGDSAVKTFMDQAEKYGYILAGSNNSKNRLSWDETNNIASLFFGDVMKRFSVDQKRIFVCGFSGGSRVACYLALNRGMIRGVIGCSAGLREIAQISAPDFSFIGFAGNRDFNYQEMADLDRVLDSSTVRHQLIVFDGIHSWPPADTVEEAFVWLQAGAMRDKSLPADKPWIDVHVRLGDSLAGICLKAGKVTEAWRVLQKTVHCFEGLADLDKLITQIASLEKSPQFLREREKLKLLTRKESAMNTEYTGYLRSKSLDWWMADIRKMNQFIHSAKDREEALVRSRVLSFLSYQAFMATNAAIRERQLEAAMRFDEIYALVDPENNEHSYLKAGILLAKGDTAGSLKALEEAIILGFRDADRLEKDAALAPLKNSDKYYKILQEIMAKQR